ncbi:hypothetical protein GCM10027589_16570 [Actinocorallia lasiicapitis]
MNRGTAFWREVFLTRLGSEQTIIVRDIVTDVMERQPTSSEMSAARKASHQIAEAGEAVLMGLYPSQAKGTGGPISGQRRLSCLTVDDALVHSLPYCVERSATLGPRWWREADPTKKGLPDPEAGQPTPAQAEWKRSLDQANELHESLLSQLRTR